MSEPTVRFPVRCPICHAEALTEFPVAAISQAFLNDQPVVLYAVCHQQVWNASETERSQIRDYLEVSWLTRQ